MVLAVARWRTLLLPFLITSVLGILYGPAVFYLGFAIHVAGVPDYVIWIWSVIAAAGAGMIALIAVRSFDRRVQR